MARKISGLQLGLGLAALLALAQPARSQLVNLRHWSGQAVAPVYEGYDTNDDGTFNMWFGYMNRNYEQEVDIPVGPENHFSPGPADRGQPTFFVIRRQKDVFRVQVPKDFSDQKLVWTLTANGKTEQVTGSLDRVWMIDRKYTTRNSSGNTLSGANEQQPISNYPPVVRVEPAEQQKIAGPGSVSLSVLATDDGRPTRQGKPIGMTYFWAKFRGPGSVKFEPARASVVDGKAVSRATFSEAGEYLLQVVVDDGSGEVAGNFGYHCCWTNVQVKVTVMGNGGAGSGQR